MEDQLVYQRRAQEILSGHLIGNVTPFYSSTLYPYILAAIYAVCGIRPTAVYLVPERKDYAKAGYEYRKALDLHPDLAAAYYNQGKDLLLVGEYRRAVRLLSRSLRLYPTDVWALNNRGLAYEHLGKLKRATRDLRLALQADPGFEPARANLRRVVAEQEERPRVP